MGSLAEYKTLAWKSFFSGSLSSSSETTENFHTVSLSDHMFEIHFHFRRFFEIFFNSIFSAFIEFIDFFAILTTVCILIFESLLDPIILFQFFLLQQTVHLSSAKVPVYSVLIMSFFFTVFLKLCFLPFEGVFYFLQKFLRGIFLIWIFHYQIIVLGLTVILLFKLQGRFWCEISILTFSFLVPIVIFHRCLDLSIFRSCWIFFLPSIVVFQSFILRECWGNVQCIIFSLSVIFN